MKGRVGVELEELGRKTRLRLLAFRKLSVQTRFPFHRWPRRFKTMQAQNCANSEYFFEASPKKLQIKGLRTHQPTENLPQQITVHCLIEAALRTGNFSSTYPVALGSSCHSGSSTVVLG